MFIFIVKCVLVKPCQNIFAVKKYFPRRPSSKDSDKGEMLGSEKNGDFENR